MPHLDRPLRRAPRRTPRRAATAALASVIAVGLVGCGAAGPAAGPDRAAPAPGATAAPVPEPSADPAPEPPSASALDVPVRSSALDAAVTVPATVAPVGLAIPDLDLTLPVDPVGVAEDGQMEIPPLAERGGWYRFGASPADAAGTAVIAAHVDSVASAGLGPFARLPDAEVGDVVDVTLADGAVRRYAVTAVTRQAKPEVSWADVFVRDGLHRLLLITCGGTFQRESGHYTDNVIVTAEPVGA